MKCYMVLQNKSNRSVVEKIDCNNKLGNKQMITIASDLTKYSQKLQDTLQTAQNTL